MQRKDSSEYGWIVIKRVEYERMMQHEYAGPGTPLHPDAPGHWAMVNEDGGTVLYTGVQVVDEDSDEPCEVAATVRNMRQYARPGLVALDLSTGETFSATVGDYFMYADDEPLCGEDGEPLVLAVRGGVRVEPLLRDSVAVE